MTFSKRLASLEYHAQVDHKIAMEIGAEADARIAELVKRLEECRDCIAADINYTSAQSWHEPATVDYLNAMLRRTDAAIDAARKEQGNVG